MFGMTISWTIASLSVLGPRSKSRWLFLEKKKKPKKLILEEKSILFSYHGRQQLLNYILTVAKQYIYKTKFFADELNLNAFISILKDKFRCEKYIAFINNTFAKFLSKWGPLYNLFN